MNWKNSIVPIKTEAGIYRFCVTIGEHSLSVDANDLTTYRAFQRRVLEQVGLLFCNSIYAQNGATGRIDWEDDIRSLVAQGRASIGGGQNAAG